MHGRAPAIHSAPVAIALVVAQCSRAPVKPAGAAGPRPVLGAAAPGVAGCVPCHPEEERLWSDGPHASVGCRACHGVEGDHTRTGLRPILPASESCLGCHALVAARREGKRAVAEVLEKHLLAVERKHVIRIDREKIRKRCVHCHDPHLTR